MEQDFSPFRLPPLQFDEKYTLVEQYHPDEERRRQLLVLTQLLMEKDLDNPLSEDYYDSTYDEADLYSFPIIKKEPAEVRKTEFEAKEDLDRDPRERAIYVVWNKSFQ